MDLAAWIKDADNQVIAALVCVGLVIVAEGVTAASPYLHFGGPPPGRTTPRRADFVAPTAPPPVAQQAAAPSRPLRLTEATYKVCVAGSPTECPTGVIYLRCGDNPASKWADQQCSRYSISGSSPGAGANCKHLDLEIRCSAQ